MTAMDFVNQEVMHRAFGSGRIVSVENEKLTVQFSEEIGEKSFPYPAVFERYLKLKDTNAQSEAQLALDQMNARLEAEKAQAVLAYQEERERQQAQARPVRKPVKKTAAKKSAASS